MGTYTTQTLPQSESPRTSDLAGWQQRAIHTIQLPSGQWVKIRLPGIATIVEHGDMPDDLLELAVAELTREGGAASLVAEGVTENGDRAKTLERLKQFSAFQRRIVAAMLVEPALTYDEITAAVYDGTLPEDDLAMVAEIGQRLRAADARGVRIGVEPLDRWAMFRDTHRGIACAGDETCEGCQKLIRAFSTADLDAV